MISYSDESVAPHSIGIIATYMCNDRYSLVGMVNRTCTEVGGVGVFLGSLPTCQRKTFV